MEHPERGHLAEVRRVEKSRPGQPGRAAQQPLGIGLGAERRLEALAGHAHREVALELGAARVQDPHAVLRRALARRGEQARLADARRSLDEERPACSLARSRQHGGDRGQLLLPIDEHRAQP